MIYYIAIGCIILVAILLYSKYKEWKDKRDIRESLAGWKRIIEGSRIIYVDKYTKDKFLENVTFIPIHTLYFQIIPPILALGIGLFVYWFTLTWKKSKLAAFWATFFTYFGGNFGWIVTLIKDGRIGGESIFWSQQSISTLLNPPFA